MVDDDRDCSLESETDTSIVADTLGDIESVIVPVHVLLRSGVPDFVALSSSETDTVFVRDNEMLVEKLCDLVMVHSRLSDKLYSKVRLDECVVSLLGERLILCENVFD